MRKHLKTTFAIAALASGLLATATVLAHESGSQKSAMMGQMSQMMKTCNEMMQSGMGGHGETKDPSPELENKG